jgi:hypothetical protein
MDEELFHRLCGSDTDSTGQSGSELSSNAPKAIFEPSSGGSATEAVVSLVAQEEDCDPLELPPLYGAVDPEALDQICTAGDGSSLCISFDYTGYTVLVDANGIVQLVDES